MKNESGIAARRPRASQGALHGNFATPRGFELVRAPLDEVWAVERNDVDVPFLVRMRVAG